MTTETEKQVARVYHAKIFSIFAPGEMELVAEILIPDEFKTLLEEDVLEYCYRWTNNIDGSWSLKSDLETPTGEYAPNLDNNDNVKVMRPLHFIDGREYGLRSTSMGDAISLNGKVYEVAATGFRLTSETEESLMNPRKYKPD